MAGAFQLDAFQNDTSFAIAGFQVDPNAAAGTGKLFIGEIQNSDGIMSASMGLS